MIKTITATEQTFPELIEAFRRSAKESKDPAFKMTFIDYLFVCAERIMEEPESLGIYFDVGRPENTDGKAKSYARYADS